MNIKEELNKYLKAIEKDGLNNGEVALCRASFIIGILTMTKILDNATDQEPAERDKLIRQLKNDIIDLKERELNANSRTRVDQI